MTHFNLKSSIRNTGWVFRSNILLLICYGIYIAIVVFFCLKQNAYSSAIYHVIPNTYDAFVFTNYYEFFVMTIACTSVFIVFNLIKQDFRVSYVIRCRHKQALYLGQIFKAVAFLLLLSAYLTLVTFVLGKVTFPEPLNWGQIDSWYYLKNGVINNQVSGLHIAVTYFFNTFFLLAGLNILAITIRWLSNNFVIAWMLIIAICLLSVRGGIIPYFAVNSIWFTNWEIKAPMERIHLTPIACLTAFTVLGLIIAKRKDFINADRT